MDLKKLLAEYKNNSIKLHLEDDFIIRKKYIDKSNSIVKKVCDNHLEEMFFANLFSSDEPWILGDAAMDAFNCRYNIHKCLSVLEYLKENAHNLVFCSDSSKNEKARKYYSSFEDIAVYKQEVEFYDSINDEYLYGKCREYFELLGKQINWYFNKSSKKYKDLSLEIFNLLNQLKEENYLSFIFDIAENKYRKSDHNLNYVALNSYYACKFNYDKVKYKTIQADILKIEQGKLTPKLISLVEEFLNEIDNSKPNGAKTLI